MAQLNTIQEIQITEATLVQSPLTIHDQETRKDYSTAPKGLEKMPNNLFQATISNVVKKLVIASLQLTLKSKLFSALATPQCYI